MISNGSLGLEVICKAMRWLDFGSKLALPPPPESHSAGTINKINQSLQFKRCQAASGAGRSWCTRVRLPFHLENSTPTTLPSGMSPPGPKSSLPSLMEHRAAVLGPLAVVTEACASFDLFYYRYRFGSAAEYDSKAHETWFGVLCVADK